MKWIVFALTFIMALPSYANDKGFALSGGISLGIYEGGVFYSLIQQNKNTIAKDTKVVYGTSAGSINGLLGVFEMCGYRTSTKENSLFWKMWIPNGLDELEAKDSKELSLLSRKSSEGLFPELRERWMEGFKEECDLHFGVAVSRKEPYVEELKEGLEIIRQAEFFSVRIRGQGRGKPPLVENQKSVDINSYRTTLPIGESPEKDVEILLGLIQASSAFPSAFEPFSLSFCYSKPGETFHGCNSVRAKKALFIDGGLYHNGPVGFAYETLKQNSRDKNFELYYINASSPYINQKGIQEKKTEKTGVMEDFQNVFGNLIVQARKYELVKSLESNPEIVKHLKINLKHLPLASDPLYAFNGFLDKDFRKADFYAGMYDGGGLNESDSEFNCFKERLESSKSTCALDEDLVVLIGLGKYRIKTKLYEGDFDKIYAYLEKHHFEFKDIGLKRSESRYGRVYVKDRLTKLVKGFAAKQPKQQQKKLKYFIRPSLNYLQYTPLKDFWYGSYGSSAEVGYSKIVPERYLESSSFRFDSVLMINGFSNFFSRAQDVWAITPLLGFEFEPVPLNGPFLQWRAGARAGYVFSPRDDLGRGTCDSDLQDEYAAACSGATIHLTLALSVLERLRFQLVYIPFIVNSTSIDEKPELLLQLGFQFGESF